MPHRTTKLRYKQETLRNSTMTDTSKTILPVAIQAYRVADTFDAGTYRMIEGQPGKQIFVTGLQITTDTAPFSLWDSTGNVLFEMRNPGVCGGSGGFQSAPGSDLNAVFESPTTLAMYISVFIA